jgi:hypothetical protein
MMQSSPTLEILRKSVAYEDDSKGWIRGPPRLWRIIRELSTGRAKVRKRWAQVRGTPREDLAIKNKMVLQTVYVIGSAISFVPLGLAIYFKLLSPYFGGLYFLAIALAVFLSLTEKDFQLFFVLIAFQTFMIVPFIRLGIEELWEDFLVTKRVRDVDRESIVGFGIGGCVAIVFMTSTICATISVGGWVWICLLPAVLCSLGKVDNPDEFIVFRRRNNLLVLVQELEEPSPRDLDRQRTMIESHQRNALSKPIS